MLKKHGPENLAAHYGEFDTICDATQVTSSLHAVTAYLPTYLPPYHLNSTIHFPCTISMLKEFSCCIDIKSCPTPLEMHNNEKPTHLSCEDLNWKKHVISPITSHSIPFLPFPSPFLLSPSIPSYSLYSLLTHSLLFPPTPVHSLLTHSLLLPPIPFHSFLFPLSTTGETRRSDGHGGS